MFSVPVLGFPFPPGQRDPGMETDAQPERNIPCDINPNTETIPSHEMCNEVKAQIEPQSKNEERDSDWRNGTTPRPYS
jgi:hypothetical protein